MKYLIGICIVVCCVLAIASPAAFADGWQTGKCNLMAGHGKTSQAADMSSIFFFKAHSILENAAELGLSSDQIEKIKALKYGIERNSIKEDADIATLVLDIKEALRKDDVDIVAVNKLVDQKYALKAQKTKEAIGAYVDLKKILTADQLAKLKEICHRGMTERHKGWKAKAESAVEKAESMHGGDAVQ